MGDQASESRRRDPWDQDPLDFKISLSFAAKLFLWSLAAYVFATLILYQMDFDKLHLVGRSQGVLKGYGILSEIRDYARWASLIGLAGWTVEKVAHHLRREAPDR